MMASYFLVFYLSTLYDANDQGVLSALSPVRPGNIHCSQHPLLHFHPDNSLPVSLQVFAAEFRYRGENYSIIEQQ
jgi:hypothetical protein